MKEYNYTNANYMTTEEELIYISAIRENDEIKFDSTAIVFGEISTQEGINANYSLTCFGDIKGDRVVIQKDLICYQDIECNVLEVGGSFKCYGHIDVNEICVAGESFLNSAYIKTGELQKALIIEGTLEVEEGLDVNSGIICKEGAVGDGNITCEYIYTNEYLEIEVDGEIINKNQIQSEKNSFSIPVINSVEDIINNKQVDEALKVRRKILRELQKSILKVGHEVQIDEIRMVLKRLVDIDSSFKDDYILINFIKKIEELKAIESITDFLELVKYDKKCPGYLRELDTCEYLFNHYLEKQRLNIDNMSCENIKSHRDFVYALTLLESVKNELKDEEYNVILEKIYGHIGIKYKLISRCFK